MHCATCHSARNMVHQLAVQQCGAHSNVEPGSNVERSVRMAPARHGRRRPTMHAAKMPPSPTGRAPNRTRTLSTACNVESRSNVEPAHSNAEPAAWPKVEYWIQ